MTACIEWTGTRTRDGYGLVPMPGDPNRRTSASRAAWIKAFGPIPDGPTRFAPFATFTPVRAAGWSVVRAQDSPERTSPCASECPSPPSTRSCRVATGREVMPPSSPPVAPRAAVRDWPEAEYALILALIAIIAIVALVYLGGNVSDLLNRVGESI